ncbi:uncharacterized protein LOC131172170 [Hevea brasiliensis]|uniref:uncharacterized protein LOC131172170 n=1 Tax=Hevea brasiliensis TaxID=3981 RepID=UPI0025DC4FB8|nr:uncharacterized protein LOC131172170 [Hevea brasiliensis]
MTVDTHAQKLHNQASTSFTFQTPIPDPTITFNPIFLSSEFHVSYHQAVSNAEFHPSTPIPSVYPATNFPTGGVAHVIGGKSREKENEKLSALEERLRAIDELNIYGSVDVSSLRLVPDVVVPLKFKVPEFDKYSRSSNPRIHLATYISKMSALIEDDRLLVHFFYESLTGAALCWCMQLDRSILRSWKDLADTFLKQYKFNYDVVLTRRDLQNLMGERIEANLRLGRLQEVVGESPMKKYTNFGKKKKGDVHSISKTHLPPLNNFCPYTSAQSPYPLAQNPMVANVPPPFSNYPRPQYPPKAAYNPRPSDQNTPFRPPASQPSSRPSRNSDPPNSDPPLPLPLSEIYCYLLGINQIVPIPLDPIQLPYPRNGWLKIEGSGSTPNVTSKPLPHYDTKKGNGVSVIESLDENLITEVDQLTLFFNEILAMAVLEGYIHLYRLNSGNDLSGLGCPYNGATNHELQNCDEFKEEIWKMISLKILRCQLKSKEEKEVNIAIYGKDISRSAPKMVFSVPTTSTFPAPPLTIIRTPPQLPVTNTHAVPWNYNFQVYTQSASSSTSIPTLNHTYTQPITTPKPCFTPHAYFKMTYTGPSNDSAPQFTSELALINDSPNLEVEFITRSGRCYGTEEKKSKGKAEVEESPETEEKVGKVVERGEPNERKE